MNKNRIIFIIFGLLQIIVWVIFFHNGCNGLAITINGIMSFFLYSFLLFSEYYYAEKMVNPILFFIFSSLIFVGVTSSFIGAQLIYLKNIGIIHCPDGQSFIASDKNIIIYSILKNFPLPANYRRFNVGLFLNTGILLMMINSYLIVASGFLLELVVKKRTRLKVKIEVSLKREYMLFFSAVGVYIISLLLYHHGQIFHLLSIYIPLGLIAHSLIISKNENSKTELWVCLAFIIFLYLFYLAISGSISKQNILISFLPFVFWGMYVSKARIRNRRLSYSGIIKKVTFGVVICFVILFTFNLNRLQRKNFYNDENKNTLTMINKAIIATTPGTDTFSAKLAFPFGDIWWIPRRVDLISYNAWCYEYTRNNEYIGNMFFKDAIKALIPRYFWSDKPKYAPGVVVRKMISGNIDPNGKGIISQYAIGLSGGLFLAGGWSYLFYLIIFGLFFSIAYYIIKEDLSESPFALAGYFYLMVNALKYFEGCPDGGIVYLSCFYMLMLPPYLFSRFILCVYNKRRISK